jgi:hypothetical protein
MRRLLVALAGASLVALASGAGASAQTTYPNGNGASGQGQVCIMSYPPPPGCGGSGAGTSPPSASWDGSGWMSGSPSYSAGSYAGGMTNPFVYASLSGLYPWYRPSPVGSTAYNPYYWSAGLRGYFGPGSYTPAPGLPVGLGLGGFGLAGLGGFPTAGLGGYSGLSGASYSGTNGTSSSTAVPLGSSPCTMSSVWVPC